jgi:hypothetical protein
MAIDKIWGYPHFKTSEDVACVYSDTCMFVCFFHMEVKQLLTWMHIFKHHLGRNPQNSG